MKAPTFIAELSANHLGDLSRAHALIDAAADAGADMIKLQTYTPEQMVSPDKIITDGPWAGQFALDLYRKAHTPRAWHRELFAHTWERDMMPFSTPFHPDDVAFLQSLNCGMYKISSFELTDTDLIKAAAATGKPLIMSTGMATLNEINQAVYAARSVCMGHVYLLKCTSAYPAKIADANLLTMDILKRICNGVGLSDHTLGHTVAMTATALGAMFIEKHLTLSRMDGGPDADFSMEPHEFAHMVSACKQVAEAVGDIHFGPTKDEEPSLQLRRQPGKMRAEG